MKVFRDESSETGVGLINQLKSMKTEDQFNCVGHALSMAMKMQSPPPASEVSLSKHIGASKPENAGPTGGSQLSSVGSAPPKKSSGATVGNDSLSRSTHTKQTFAGSPDFRRAFTFMLSLLKKEERESLTEKFRAELGSGKEGLQQIIERLDALQKLFNGIDKFADSSGRVSQETVEHGFKKLAWDRGFHDFIVAKLSEPDYASV